jgi:hypothetical protein
MSNHRQRLRKPDLANINPLSCCIARALNDFPLWQMIVAAAKLLWRKLYCPATVNVEHHAGQKRYPCIEYPPSTGIATPLMKFEAGAGATANIPPGPKAQTFAKRSICTCVLSRSQAIAQFTCTAWLLSCCHHVRSNVGNLARTSAGNVGARKCNRSSASPLAVGPVRDHFKLGGRGRPNSLRERFGRTRRSTWPRTQNSLHSRYVSSWPTHASTANWQQS